MAARKKKKNPDPVKINFSGSSTVAEDLDIDERVIFIVEGTVGKSGTASTATQGHQEFRTIKMESALLAPDDLREQLAILVQTAKDDAAGVQSIDFPDPEADTDGEPE